MKNKILVISPYNIDLLKALINAVVSKIAQIMIVGNKGKLLDNCLIHNINYHLFDFYDCDYDIDICFKVNELIKEHNIKIIIYGEFPKEFQQNIAIPEYEINVVDIPKLRHLIFLSTSLKNEYIGYDEKKDAIIVAKRFMKSLQINYCAIGIVCSHPSKTTFIEKNVIRMNPELTANIIDIIPAKDIFSDHHNLLIFESLDTTKVFIDAVVYNDDAKYASIKKASELYIIDANLLRLRDIFFSIFLLNKLSLNTEAS